MKKQKIYAPNSKMVTSNLNFNSGITESERETGNQEVADLVLMRFDSVRRLLCQLDCRKGALLTAFTNCRNLGIRTNMKKRIGPDNSWSSIGLHMQMVTGINYLTVKDGAIEGLLATSVVTSGHCRDETEKIKTFVYTGHGGTDKIGQAIDKKLVRGNLALEASKKKGNETAKGKSGFDEYKFRLVRKSGQPSGYANWKSVERWRKCDISRGSEASSPISFVNEINENDKERPEHFSYSNNQLFISRTIDPHHRSIGCSGCFGWLCSIHEDPNCYCIKRNGGKLPYLDRVLVCRKPMIYECGHPCACPHECKLRVTQNNLKICMEVFKTKKYGWGLCLLELIRVELSFAGLLLVGEYCWEQTSEVYNIKSRLLISARRDMNVSRLMNHRCSPNVIWQPVESNKNHKPCFRIAFFAMIHIPPLLTELRYDYGMSKR
ncbi:hypothetical protein EUTSA_v10012335mg, partial [Eutrema salsugineum]